jgi:type II secretion system protein J
MKRLPHVSRVAEVKPYRGFTLIEMMVAVSIFAIVMMVGVGALLSLVQINKRAQAVNSVMNNLNSALESMSRSIRVGTNYYCATSATPPSPTVLATTQDCPGTTGNPAGILLAFESPSGDPANVNDQVVYRLNGNQLERSLSSGANGSWVALTAPEVTITSFNFYVIGAPRGDFLQPRVLMRIIGTANVPGGSTSFSIQASVVQRLLDF